MVVAMVSITAAVVGCKDSSLEVAQITFVDAVTKEVKTPHQICQDVAVSRQVESDDGKVMGTVAGGAAGAALGSQIGGGSGKTIATATGTVAGAVVGRKVQEGMKDAETITTTEKQCHTEYTTSTEVVGYDVTYELDGKVATARLNNKPLTNTFPVENGRVVLPQ